MGRTVAMLWHASFSILAGAAYFFCVLPRWPELMGNLSHAVGTAGRIACGLLIGLAALPVVFTLLRTRKPEYGTPQLALTLRTSSIVAHVLAGVMIVGTAISEIWLSLDSAGQWLFGVYGAAAAVAVLGIFAFYLSFVAALPPPPPKPLKPKERRQRRRRREEDTEDTEAAETAETEEAEVPAGEATETEEAGVPAGEATGETEAAEADAQTAEADEPETEQVEAGETVAAPIPEPTEATVAARVPAEATVAARVPAATQEIPKPAADELPAAEDTVAAEVPRGGLRNRRPSGKSATSRHRLRRPRGGVTLEE